MIVAKITNRGKKNKEDSGFRPFIVSICIQSKKELIELIQKIDTQPKGFSSNDIVFWQSLFNEYDLWGMDYPEDIMKKDVNKSTNIESTKEELMYFTENFRNMEGIQ
jgi:hypothetical protein